MRRLDALFRDTPELRKLSRQAAAVDRLQQLWDIVAPPPLHRAAHAANLEQGRLTVFADNGAVASKLKMLAPTLLKSLQNKGLEVTSIHVEVQVKSLPRARPRPARTLTASAARQLRSLAGELPDSPLRDILQRLANRRG